MEELGAVAILAAYCRAVLCRAVTLTSQPLDARSYCIDLLGLLSYFRHKKEQHL